MKKRFTILIAALMLLTMISQPTRLWGQATTDAYKKTKFNSTNNSQGVQNYTSTWYNTTNGFRVDITNANNNNNGWNYIKMGRKNNASTGTIITNASIDKPVSSVSIRISALTASKITSITLYTKTANGSWSSAGTFTKSTGLQSVNIQSPTKDLYYKIEAVCTSGSDNGLLTIDSVLYNVETFTVTYNNNGGSGTMTDSNSPYWIGSTVTTKANTFTAPTGYTFSGWNTAANGSGTSYAAGATFTINANTTLYAQWEASGPAVSIDPTAWDFGEVTVNQTSQKTFSVTHANLSSALSIEVPSGYTVEPNSIAQNASSPTNVTVTFAPTSVSGNYNDNLSITGGGLGSAVTASLSGTGGCITAPTLTYTSPVNLTLENGEVEYTLAPTGGGNGGSISYAVTTNPGNNGEIINGNKFYAIETGQYVVTATQAASGNYCECVATITINVTGTDPVCEITPSTGHNFGTILTNTSESFDFSVAIANLEHGLTLSVPSGYEVSPSSIAANASSPVNVTVTFTPTAATAYNGSLTISGDDFDNDITAALSGTGDAGRTVTFEPYSGSCDPTSIRVLTGGSIATLPTATADGATFYGWATSKVASTPTAPTSSIVSAPYTPTGNVTLHAVYKIAKEFDNTAACAGSYKIYATVSTTDYYATGSISSGKYSSTTTAANGKSFTFVKETGYGNDEWAIKDGDNYVYYVSSTTLGTQASAYKWKITQGVKGTWRATSATTTTRAILFSNDNSTNKFAAYATSNIVNPNQGNYYDIEFGSASFTYNSEAPVAKPTFNIAGGSYAGEQSITISCATLGATIYYTTNGSDPTASSTEYTGAITVDETKTIKAIAIKSGMANSTVAYATYSIVPLLTTMDEIFAAATANGETAGDVAVTFNNWLVSGKSGDYVAYVTDNNGKGFKIYKYGHGFKVNDKLSGTVTGTPLKLDNGASQFTNLATSSEGLTVTPDGGTITPVAKTISELGGVNTGAVVTISNLSYNGSNLVDGSENTITPNNSLFSYGSALTSGHDYSSITGVFVMNNTTKQIHPRSAADIVEVEYNITLNDVPSGCTIGTEGSITTAKYGQTVTLTQSAGDGYRFISWSVNSGAVTVTDNQFTMPKGAVTVSATFAPTYTIATSVTPENTGTVTADPNPAIEGETVTLTIAPAEGKALKSISAYRTDAPSTPVTITDNTITMPAYGVTVAAEFATEYSVSYNVNGGTGDAVVVKYGAGATVNATDVPGAWTAPEGKLFKNWKTVASGEGTEYEVGDKITDNIAANYVLYAQWRDIVYTVSFSVNGVVDHNNDIEVAYNTAIGTLPEDPELAPLTFLGWSSTSATGATNVTASWKPTGENENVTVYAVFGSMSTDNFTLTGTTTNIPTGYSSYTWTINDETYFHTENVMQGQYSTSKFIQYRKDNGYIYNDKDFGKITSIVLNYYTGTQGGGDNRDIRIKIHNSIINDASTGTEMTSSGDGAERTFTYDVEHYDYHYFRIYNSNSSNLNTLNSIQINYEAAAPLTVNVIDENTNMTTDIEATTCVVVTNGATLNFTGTNKGNANNLVIENGGQLIVTNTGVQATVKKTVANSTAKTANKYYTISSPVKNQGIAAFVAAQGGVTHNIYRYDAANILWQDYRIDNGGHYNFTTFTNGQGYLFRTLFNGDITYSGELNVADQTFTLSYDADNTLKSFNLIGNPFSHNIYKNDNYQAEGDKPAINSANLATGYYRINGGETFVPTIGYNNPIKPGEGVLVLATGSETLAITNTINPAASYSGEVGTKAGNDNLMFTVSNDQYEDVTYALFSKGYGLNKINHRSEYAPMLYIPQNDEDFAIAMMDDDTQAFNLNFEAKTTGKYTLSFKANGEFNYLHVIDRMTGEDVDMLLEGEYSFIGSPMDNANRFIVRLGYLPNYDDNGEDIFAYQSGSDVVVSGEGELQIFDVMGRMIATQRINGVETISLSTQGVYILRLNGNTQKIVVK